MVRLFLIASLLFVAAVSIRAPSRQIVNFPGSPSVNFKSYSGYVPIPGTPRELFYVFSESQRSPSTDPVVLWLTGMHRTFSFFISFFFFFFLTLLLQNTGGPGCSSLMAMFSENGPFRPDPSSPSDKLVMDDYSWNRISNMIWLESPAGVGFSITNEPKTGDAQTTNDTYAFLEAFFGELFPEHQSNEFWVTGESYGGHYVPLISHKVVTENANNPRVHINIKGHMVGNAWTYMPIDNAGAIDTWWTRGITPKSYVDDIKANCNLSYVGPLLSKRDAKHESCNDAINKAMESFNHVNIYDIYVDVCPGSSDLILGQMAKYSWFHAAMYNSLQKHRKRTNPPLPPFDDCVDEHISDYLNNPVVQAAMHVKKPTNWQACSSYVEYNFNDVATRYCLFFLLFIYNVRSHLIPP